MRLLILCGFACALAVGPAAAESAALAPEAASLNTRVLEAMSMHGVWYSPERYIPFYCDSQLVAYLAAAKGPGQPDFVIIPVFSSQSIHFRRGHLVFVSVGLILHAQDEDELFRTIRPDIRCVAGDASGFRDMESRLASQVAEYTEATRPQLRRR